LIISVQLILHVWVCVFESVTVVSVVDVVTILNTHIVVIVITILYCLVAKNIFLKSIDWNPITSSTWCLGLLKRWQGLFTGGIPGLRDWGPIFVVFFVLKVHGIMRLIIQESLTFKEVLSALESRLLLHSLE